MGSLLGISLPFFLKNQLLKLKKYFMSTINFTDRFFIFPITIYLTDEVMEAQELSENIGVTVDPEGVEGFARVLPEDLCCWWDTFSKSLRAEQAREAKFDHTVVITKNREAFSCCWNRLEFE